MRIPVLPTIFLWAALSLVAAVPGHAQETPPPAPEEAPAGQRLAALIERMRYENTLLHTLQAKFFQTKESSMLVEAEETSGSLFYEAPDQVRWEYLTPNPISILIGGERMTTWYRDLGQAEQVDVGRKSQKILRYMGAANSIETLLEYFTVRLKMPDEPDAPYRLHLIPRYEQVEKRLQEMRVDIDRKLFIPVYLRYVEPDGDTTEYRFEDLQINGDLPADTFDLQLPESVELRLLKQE